MKKQLIIMGIILLFVCVGLSGCDNDTIDEMDENRPGIPFLHPNYAIGYGFATDNCLSVVNQSNGTVWVNFSIYNAGGEGQVQAYAQVYQGIGDYQSCGNGTVYNQTRMSWYKLQNNESVYASFVFTGINCATGAGCYGYKYWII